MKHKDPQIRIRDLTTREVFSVDAGVNTIVVRTMDGVRVKLHPVSLRYLVPTGSKFDGHTITGPRPMERL